MRLPKLYADTPVRAAAQLVADLAALVWIYVWLRVGSAVHATVSTLAEPGRRLEQAGTELAGGLSSAAEAVQDVPLVGDALRPPFDGAADGARGLASAGRDQQEVVADLATLLAVVTVAVPLTLALLFWLLPRLRFVRRATAAQRFIDSAADLDLFALRAMTRQPFHRLARVSADPVGDWRRGDPGVVRALAALELRSTGLRPPG